MNATPCFPAGWMALGVDPEIAGEDACRMEHVISAESFAAIKNHVQKSFQKST